jgi:hypothetical protein
MLTSPRHRREAELVLLVASSAALVVATVADAPQPWRATVAAVFFLLGPGLAVVAPMQLRFDLELALTVPVSLAMTSLASLPLFYLEVWSGGLAVAVLVAVCAGGALAVWSQPRSVVGALATASTQGRDQ